MQKLRSLLGQVTFYFFICFTFWILLFTCHSLQPPSTSGPTALQLYWALLQPTHWYRKCKDTKRHITVLDGSNDWLLWSKSKSPLGCVCSSAAPSPAPRLPPCPETIPAIKGEKGFKVIKTNSLSLSWARQIMQMKAYFWQNKKNQQR